MSFLGFGYVRDYQKEVERLQSEVYALREDLSWCWKRMDQLNVIIEKIAKGKDSIKANIVELAKVKKSYQKQEKLDEIPPHQA